MLEIVNCFGCLNSDRKMMQIKDTKVRECFIQLIKEAAMPLQSMDQLLLCWECTALLFRFFKFKQQVVESYKSMSNIKSRSWETKQRLKTQSIFNVNYIPDNTVDNHVEVIPIHNCIEVDVKIEHDSFSDDVVVETAKKSKKKKVRHIKKNIKVEYLEVELNEEELFEERNKLANDENYLNAMFRCENCILTFSNSDDLDDHITDKHKKYASMFKCKMCERTFNLEVSYNYHMNSHLKRYECVVCGERCPSKRLAIKHYNTMHLLGTEVEIKEKAQESLTDTSNKAPDGQSVFSCEFCPKAFMWRTSLRKHTEAHRIESGQKRKPYCEPCKLSFRTTSNLQKHAKTSSKHQIQLKIWKMKQMLPEVNGNPEKQQAHEEEIKSLVNKTREQFPCGQCGKLFQWKGNLQRHMKSHAAKANGELVCVPCDRSFSSIATYRQHMAISKKHVTEDAYKYMCSDCGKRFSSKTNLKDHINWDHLKNYVHTCQDCQKVFKTHTSLYLHNQVVHKKGGEHLCDHCGKSFPIHAKLRTHKAVVHSGAAAYRCPVCGKRFAWHSCLSRHVRRLHRKKAPH